MAKGKFAQRLLDELSQRMSRAKNMSFMTDMPLYHGTNKEITEFSLEKGGEVSGSPVGKLGVSLAVDPDTAGEFAHLAGNEGANVIPVYHRASKPARIELDGSETNFEVAATVQQAWDEGFDAIKFDNYTTPGGEKGRSFVLVRDPSQIRSVNAGFDPGKKESSNLLAETLGPTAGIALTGMASDSEAFTEPKGKFSQSLLADYINQNPEELLIRYPERPTWKGPVSPWAAKAAEWALKYNQGRKKRIHPMLDLVLPGGEMPYEYLNKKAYGEETTIMDRANAVLGLL